MSVFEKWAFLKNGPFFKLWTFKKIACRLLKLRHFLLIILKSSVPFLKEDVVSFKTF